MGLLAGCSLFELKLSSPTEVETANLRISADQIRYSFDGYCGVGVKIENTSDRTVHFAEDDVEIFDGASFTEWDPVHGCPHGG